MKKLHTFFAAALLFGAGSLVKTEVAFAQASSVGQLRGIVKDKGTNEPAVGATVVATSPALQGEQVVITDETGQYFVTSLPEIDTVTSAVCLRCVRRKCSAAASCVLSG